MMRTKNATTVPTTKWNELKKGKRVLLPLLVFLSILTLAASCTSKKKLVSPLAHASHYEWMSAKMNGELIAENEVWPFSGILRMRCDSTIWISASALMGLESVRTLITHDSVIMINRMNQTYLAETLEEACRGVALSPMTVRDFQSMLLGNGTSDHVELQYGPYTAKILYSDIRWDEPTTFPMKINKKYERIKP